MRVDTAVVGGGIAGVTTADKLAATGQTVALLERVPILNGVTGHTTAKVTSLHGLIYDHLIDDFGIERAQQYAQANQAAIEDDALYFSRLFPKRSYVVAAKLEGTAPGGVYYYSGSVLLGPAPRRRGRPRPARGTEPPHRTGREYGGAIPNARTSGPRTVRRRLHRVPLGHAGLCLGRGACGEFTHVDQFRECRRHWRVSRRRARARSSVGAVLENDEGETSTQPISIEGQG